MIDNLFLEYYYTERGPGKVVENLKKGLDMLGIDVVKNIADSSNIGSLQLSGETHNPNYDFSAYEGKKCLMGPSCFQPTPDEKPHVAKKFRDIVAPSEWIRQMHLSYSELIGDVHVWAAGIDTSSWVPSSVPNDSKPLDCFIYFKHRDLSEANEVCHHLNHLGLKYNAVQYGSYTPDMLRELVRLSKFCILIDNTESQGIAYMQMLSSNLPILVFNRDWYIHPTSGVKYNASSVPYFDNRCGIVETSIDPEHIVRMVDTYKSFNPREYILENHTLLMSAKKYINLLESCKLVV